MTLKAVIFDVYNTLFDNNRFHWLETFRDICQAQQIPVIAEDLWRTWRLFEGQFRQTRTNLEDPNNAPQFKTYEEAWADAFTLAFSSLGITGDCDQAAALCVEHMSRREPYSDTIKLLDYVGHNWSLALLTNADNRSVLPLLDKYDLTFDAVVTSEMAGAYKPDPKAFHKVIKEVGFGVDEIMYVGDTQFDDVHGAKSVGLSVIWVNPERTPMEEGLLSADYEVRNLKQIMDLLETMKEDNLS